MDLSRYSKNMFQGSVLRHQEFAPQLQPLPIARPHLRQLETRNDEVIARDQRQRASEVNSTGRFFRTKYGHIRRLQEPLRMGLRLQEPEYLRKGLSAVWEIYEPSAMRKRRWSDSGLASTTRSRAKLSAKPQITPQPENPFSY